MKAWLDEEGCLCVERANVRKRMECFHKTYGNDVTFCSDDCPILYEVKTQTKLFITPGCTNVHIAYETTDERGKYD